MPDKKYRYPFVQLMDVDRIQVLLEKLANFTYGSL
jgi:hypothetical protein